MLTEYIVSVFPDHSEVITRKVQEEVAALRST